MLTGDDAHAEEIDPEIIGPFASKSELVETIEALPAWVLPPEEKEDEDG